MNSIKSIFSLTMLLLITSTLSAQDLKQIIPKDAFFVVEINTQKMNSKYDMNKIKQYDFMKMLEDEMKAEGTDMSAFYKDPTSYGLKENSNYLFYGVIKGDETHPTMMMELEDKAKYAASITERTGAKIQSGKNDAYQFATYEDASYGWNDKYAVINFPPMSDDKTDETMTDELELEPMDGEMAPPPPPPSSNEPAIEKPGMTTNVSPKTLAQTMNTFNSMFNTNSANSILSNTSFMKTMVKSHDIKFWVNNEAKGGVGSKMMGMPGMPPAMDKIMENMYKGYIVHGGLDFNAGAVDVTVNTNMDGDMAKIFRSATNNVLNKNAAKYIKKENLIGYFSLAYNIDNTVSTLKDVFSPMEKEIKDAESGLDGMMSTFGMGMNSNDIYKLLEGDMVIAMTGMREFEKEVTTYEYDDDFNRTEIKKNKKEPLPEFVMLFSSENQENVQKLFDMGKNMSMISEGEKYYTVPVPGSPMDVNMTMQNGMLIVSNDTELMNGNLKKGLKRKHRISKNHRKDLLLNSQTFFWDLETTLNLVKTLMPSDPTSDKVMAAMEDSMESMEFNTSKMVGNTMVSKGQLTFKNKKLNSIEQFFNMINEMSFIMESGMRM